MPPVIVKKSDHSNIYATTDLATLLQRQRDFAPGTASGNVVDNRQSLLYAGISLCEKGRGDSFGYGAPIFGIRHDERAGWETL